MVHAAVVDAVDLTIAREWLACGRVEQAQAEFERCLEHGVAPVTARFFCGLCQFRQNDVASALTAFTEVVRARPRDHIAHFYAGLCHERLGYEDQARECYRTALELDPGQPGFGPFLAAGWTLNPRAAGTTPSDAPGVENEPSAWSVSGTSDQAGVGLAGRCLLSAHPRFRAFAGHLLATFAACLASVATLVAALSDAAFLGLFQLSLAVCALLAVALALRSVSTHYEIYERRIDIRTGIFLRTLRSVWVHRIEDVWAARQRLFGWMGDPVLHLRAGGPGIPAAWPRHFRLHGLGDRAFVSGLRNEIHTAAIEERRGLRRWSD